jgi:hypothetical protein
VTAARAGGWGAGFLVVVAGLMLLLGYPLVGPYGAAGLLLLGALPAALPPPARRWPAAVLLVATAGAAAVEIAVAGPDTGVLDGERVTTGLAVLDRFVTGWPLVLALLLLVAAVEHGRSAARPSRGRALAGAVAAGALLAGLVLLAGLGRGWLAALPFALAYGLPALFLLGAVVALALRRGRLVAPTGVLGVALAIAVVAGWVLPVGDPVAGLVSSSTIWFVLALVLGAVELAARAAVRRALGRPVAA